MKKWITYLCCLLLCSTAFASDTTKVLFIGNSFTAVEDVPGLVKSLAEEAGMPMEIWAHTPGGISVGDVAQGQMAHMNNPQVFELIRNNELDFVILQDNQGRFVNNNGFPNPAQSKVVEGHMKIRDSMRHHHSCARMIFFAGWALKNCWPDIGDGNQCINNIYKNYKTLNTTAQEIISPIGIAWMRSIQQLPAVDLWSADEAHQSAAGAYLTAAAIFSTIYRINTEEVQFAAQMDTAVARKLRRIAYQTVMDSIQPTGLSAHMPSLERNGNTLTSATGFVLYEWYRNGVMVTSTPTNSYAVNSTGCYQVVVTDNKGCKKRSLELCIDQVTGIRELQKDHITIMPNPASSNILLEAGHKGKTKKYRIVSMTGQEVASGAFTDVSVHIPIATLAEGLYICSIVMDQSIVYARLLKTAK